MRCAPHDYRKQPGVFKRLFGTFMRVHTPVAIHRAPIWCAKSLLLSLPTYAIQNKYITSQRKYGARNASVPLSGSRISLWKCNRSSRDACLHMQHPETPEANRSKRRLIAKSYLLVLARARVREERKCESFPSERNCDKRSKQITQLHSSFQVDSCDQTSSRSVQPAPEHLKA